MLAELMREVLALAPNYSASTNPQMRRRKDALDEMASVAESWLPEWSGEYTKALGMCAQGGGQQGAVSPIAWMRVFSRVNSPNATRGLYCVYLFDAVGSSAFLSLNMGTSELRNGHWRSINDAHAIERQSDWIRLGLDRMGVDLSWADDEPMNLRVDALVDTGVVRSVDPALKARNYEAGNVASLHYERGSIPEDEFLKADLFGALSALVRS